MSKYILALDQGTTSSRAIVFNNKGEIVVQIQEEFPQIFPKSGWVEHDPIDIWNSQKKVMLKAVEMSGIAPEDIAAIGITNQRETAVLWDRNGRPACNAIVWQCRRTAEMCDRLKAEGYADMILEKTGLLIDAYFSGTKLRWMLDHIENGQERAENGELLFGTVDSWLIYKLTGGRTHASDVTNCSRTMLFNIHDLKWDEDLLKMLDIPKKVLPKPVMSSGLIGYTDKEIFGIEIPIMGCAGDQHAALFGQTCFNKGDAKNTYGTGCFLLMNTGDEIKESSNGLVSTIAWGIDGKVEYALEGSIFIGGAVIQWLRDELRVIRSAAESESVASSVPDAGGVVLVPAFTGLGAPHWDMYARGTILGLTRGSSDAHIVRAALDAIAQQSTDVLRAMEKDSGLKMEKLLVDGGASANNLLMQIQADLLGCEVLRPTCVETTALGAAYLAGLAAGVWKDKDEIREMHSIDRSFTSVITEDERDQKRAEWNHAVDTVKYWSKS